MIGFLRRLFQNFRNLFKVIPSWDAVIERMDFSVDLNAVMEAAHVQMPK
jgi:hypothetical protein